MASKTTAVSKAFTKTQLVTELAENTNLLKKDVANVLTELGTVIERHLKKRSVGEINLDGLMKLKVQTVPARKAQKNLPNPFKPGETMDVAARPASRKVKILPLKKVKDMVT